MNPRYRRLLIPGLLTVLIVVVLLTSLARSAKGATAMPDKKGKDVVSTIRDSRIEESSGLALSATDKDLVYTINDSGNAPIVYAIRVSTGKTVGATTIRGGSLVDTEALSIERDGTLWIADTGDNDKRRTDIALYSLPEPGTGNHTVTATRYPISYADGPHNVEAFLINPVTGDKLLATKATPGGKLLKLPHTLSTTSTNSPSVVSTIVPAIVTDGTFTPDGRLAVLRTYESMSVYDTSTRKLLRGADLPHQKQGETIVVESGGHSILIGTEGKNSKLLRVPLDTSAPSRAEETAAADDASGTGNDRPWVGVGVAGVILLAGGAFVARRIR